MRSGDVYENVCMIHFQLFEKLDENLSKWIHKRALVGNEYIWKWLIKKNRKKKRTKNFKREIHVKNETFCLTFLFWYQSIADEWRTLTFMIKLIIRMHVLYKLTLYFHLRNRQSIYPHTHTHIASTCSIEKRSNCKVHFVMLLKAFYDIFQPFRNLNEIFFLLHFLFMIFSWQLYR